VPKTYYGKAVASLCAICGILIIAMPVGLLSGKFSQYHKENEAKRKILERLAHSKTQNKNCQNQKEQIFDEKQIEIER